MTTLFRIVLVIACIGTFARVIQRIRQAKMQIEDAVFWVLLCVMLLLFALIPAIPDALAGLVGVYSTPNFLFLLIIFILLLKVFSLSLHISALEQRVAALAQAQALDCAQRTADERKERTKEEAKEQVKEQLT